MQEFIVLILFSFSVLYLIREFRKNFSAKSSHTCPKGCGTCSSTELKKIASELHQTAKKQAH